MLSHFSGDWTRVDQLPLLIVGSGVAQAAERQSDSHCGGSVVPILHVVGFFRS